MNPNMSTTTKLRYMVCGGFLVVLGLIISSISPSTARVERFAVENIECRRLVIHDDKGAPRIVLSNENNKPEIVLYGDADPLITSTVKLSASFRGAYISS